NVCVPNDVSGTDGGDQLNGNILCNQCLQQLPPKSLRRGRVLVGEIDEADAASAVQPANLGGDPGRIAVPPAGPKAALATVCAMVRTTAGELNNRRPARPPVLVTVPVLDQFPPDPIGVKALDRRRRPV